MGARWLRIERDERDERDEREKKANCPIKRLISISKDRFQAQCLRMIKASIDTERYAVVFLVFHFTTTAIPSDSAFLSSVGSIPPSVFPLQLSISILAAAKL